MNREKKNKTSFSVADMILCNSMQFQKVTIAEFRFKKVT